MQIFRKKLLQNRPKTCGKIKNITSPCHKASVDKKVSKISRLKKMIKINLVIKTMVLTCVLTGCQTLTPEECKLGDWYGIGINDGKHGRDRSHLGKHAKACAKVKISPDINAWEKGRQAGLKSYCLADNAYRLGKNGRHLANVCDFLDDSKRRWLYQRNEDGLAVYELNKRISKNKRQLEKMRRDFAKLKKGDMLNFKSEKEARLYLLQLQESIFQSEQSLLQQQSKLAFMK